MPFGVSIQHARLLSDILEDCASDAQSEKFLLGLPPLTSKFNLGPKNDIPFSRVISKPLESDELSSTLPLFGMSSSDDPDTESDENGSSSSVTSVSSSDDENLSEPSFSRQKFDDDDLFRKGPVDERACAKLLQNKINAVLDNLEIDSKTTRKVLEGCAYLPSDLKLELLTRSIARKRITDAALLCFLSDFKEAGSDKRMVRGTDLAKKLQQLSLCECQNITDSGLRTIASCCPQIHALDLTGCHGITAMGLQDLIRSCTNLSELCLSGCPAFCDKTISTIFRYNIPSHIRCLSVRRCDIHDYGLSQIASYCPTLQKLDVRSCGLLTANGFRALIQRVPSMSMLSCGHCVGMDDAGLSHLAQGYGSSLTDVSLESCWRVSSRGVNELARYCKQLRTLNLSSCSGVDDSALKAICRNPFLRNSLQAVNLNECNVGDDALEELVVNCTSLVFISVVGCPRVTYQRAARIAQLAGIQIVM